MRTIRSFLSVMIAGSLAIVATLTIAEIGALAGLGRNGHVNTAVLCLCLIAVFHVMARQAARRFDR